MPISVVSAHLLLRSLGVHVLMTDARLGNLCANYRATTVTAVNGDVVRVNAVVSILCPGAVAPGVFSQPRFNAAKRFLDHINAGASVPAVRALIDEAETVLDWLRLSFAALTANNVPPTALLRQHWGNVLPAQQAGIRLFAQLRNALSVVQTLINFANVPGGPALTNLSTLGRLAEAVNGCRDVLDKNRFAGITEVAFPNLRTLYGLHGPNSAFAGFVRWGPGDHGSPELNLKYHFLKHVCYAGVESEFPRESAWWWGVLDIRLTLDQMNGFFAGSVAEHERNVVRAMFNDDEDLIPAKRLQFLLLGVVSQNPKLLSYLVDNYQNAYRDQALHPHVAMTDKIVQSNGEKVFISGAVRIAGGTRGVFIIGRLDDAGLLGVSACYMCEKIQDKLTPAAKNKVWDLA
ncbi:hypothetical protein ACSFBF_30820 [Variovorax sp. ZT5P49]|uniref:hypothetical protein n=1 Tax=Variovorax sp. ZT5P49 TaxID=3443733 RepID=UPI003F4563E2